MNIVLAITIGLAFLIYLNKENLMEFMAVLVYFGLVALGVAPVALLIMWVMR